MQRENLKHVWAEIRQQLQPLAVVSLCTHGEIVYLPLYLDRVPAHLLQPPPLFVKPETSVISRGTHVLQTWRGSQSAWTGGSVWCLPQAVTCRVCETRILARCGWGGYWRVREGRCALSRCMHFPPCDGVSIFSIIVLGCNCSTQHGGILRRMCMGPLTSEERGGWGGGEIVANCYLGWML